MALTSENYQKGFLIDEDLMAGVTQNSEKAGQYIAFVLHVESGEYLGHQSYSDLDLALSSINQIPRKWAYEKSGGCGGCKDGSCGKGSCDAGACKVGGC